MPKLSNSAAKNKALPKSVVKSRLSIAKGDWENKCLKAFGNRSNTHETKDYTATIMGQIKDYCLLCNTSTYLQNLCQAILAI